MEDGYQKLIAVLDDLLLHLADHSLFVERIGICKKVQDVSVDCGHSRGIIVLALGEQPLHTLEN